MNQLTADFDVIDSFESFACKRDGLSRAQAVFSNVEHGYNLTHTKSRQDIGEVFVKYLDGDSF
jgi:hypothetical protein